MTAEVVEVALFTADVDAMRRFYERILGVPPEAEWHGGAVFAAGGTKILLHEQMPVHESGGPPNEDHVALGASDLDRSCTELRAGGLELLVEPRDYPWGRSAYLRDPDGRLIELAQL